MKKIFVILFLSAGCLARAQVNKPIAGQQDIRNYDELRALANPEKELYNVSTNGIAGQFKYDPTDVKSADDSVMVIVSKSGKRFKRSYLGEIWVEWFGADPANADNSIYFQKCSDFIINHGLTAKMKIGGGIFKVSNWVIYKRATANTMDYVSITIEGVANPFDGNVGKITELVNPTGHGGIVHFIHGLSCSMRNISFAGYCSPPNSMNELVTFKDADWNKSGAVDDDRFSPVTLISIDAINANVPVGHRWAGLDAFYSGNLTGVGSSMMLFENIAMRNSITGFLIATAPGMTNGDNVVVNNLQAQRIRSLWAVGATQTRANKIENLYGGNIGTVIDCMTYGDQHGTPPSLQNSSLAGGIKYIYQTYTDFGGLQLFNVRTESLWSIGKSVGNFPVDINRCEIVFDDGTTFQAPVLAEGGTINFKGGLIGYYDGVQVKGEMFNNRAVSFDGTNIASGIPMNLGSATVPRPVLLSNVTLFNLANTLQFLGNGTYTQIIGTCSRKPMQPEEVIHDPGGGDYRMKDGDKLQLIPVESHPLIINPANFTGYFRCTVPALFSPGSMLTTDANVDYSNDVFSATKPIVGYITAVAGDTVKLKYIPFGLKSGTTYNYYIARFASFVPRCIGDITKGSDTIKNMVINNLSFNYPELGSFIGGCSAIQPGSRVVAVGKGYIVLSLPATGTVQHVELRDATVEAEFRGGHYDISDAHRLFYTGDKVFPARVRDGLEDDSTLIYYYCTRGGIPGSANPPGWSLVYGAGGKVSIKEVTASSFTPDASGTHYAFLGTSATTWTLPNLAASQRQTYFIKNAGSANILLQRGGSDRLYDTSAVISITISPGTSRTIYAGPSYWYVE
jgi:hypothetical protein